jgi:chromosomal replication initiator protein
MHAPMMGPDRQLWAGMLAHLKSHHPALCRQWFHELEPLGVDTGVLRLRAQSAIHRDYLQRSCSDQFSDAARTVSKHLLTVQFLGPDDELPRPKPAPAVAANGHANGVSANHGLSIEVKPVANGVGVMSGSPTATNLVRSMGEKAAARIAQPAPAPQSVPAWDLTTKPSRPDTDSLVINPDYSFENFVIGPENRMSHAAAMAVCANPGRVYNPYFVHGGVGLGKTHLLQALCLRIKENNPDARIYYTSCEGFITQYMDAVQAGEMTSFRHRFRDVDLLVIDDIHFLAKRDRSQEEFFHTFNSLYQGQKQIVLSSDAPPEDIPELEDRLVSRFKWGLVTSVAPPCYETRVQILKNKALVRGFPLPDDVACHIAARIDSNIRELEGAIVKLHVHASVEKRPIDLALAAAALGEQPLRNERQVQIQTIIDAVVGFYGVKITDLQSKRRQRSIALPRQVCMYLARKTTRYSLEEIGGYFGGRDHTTVMHAVRTIEDRCQIDTDFSKTMENLQAQIKGIVGAVN